MSEYNYNEKFFEQIDTEEKAYWLGFLYADGYIEPIYRKEKIKAMRIELGLQKSDQVHLENFLLHIESNVPITQRIIKLNSKEYLSSRVRINNTKMCRDLIKLGCTTKKSLVLEFPNNNIVPEHLLRHFIRGYFDGDGCVYFRENKRIDSRNHKEYDHKELMISFVGTKDFLNSLNNSLLKHNIKFKANNSSNCGKASEIRLTKRDELFTFYNYLYDGQTICLERKLNKIQYAFERMNVS